LQSFLLSGFSMLGMNMASRDWSVTAKAFAALSVGVLVLAGCGKSVPDTIKIGVAQPLSGTSAARGQDVLNGVNLAVNELNDKGYKIDGKLVKLEVVAKDDKADPETAKKVAQELVDEKVSVVIGHLSSDISAITVPIYKQGNVPQLYTSTATDLTKAGDGNTFRLLANDTLQAQALAGYLGDMLKASSVAIIFEDTAFGKPISKDLAATLGQQKKKVTLYQGVDNKLTDFSPHIAKLKAEKSDVIVAILRDNQLLPFLKQLNEAGLAETPVLATNSAKTPKVAKAPMDVNKLFVTSSAADAQEFIGGAAFLSKFRAAYKSEPVWGAHYAYDAVYVLADTFSRAESLKPDAIRAMLRTIDPTAPVTSSMRFDKDGEQRYAAFSVYRRVNGQWESLMRSDKW
jgi:branched-chain amino acid transport system substrate-binding protein